MTSPFDWALPDATRRCLTLGGQMVAASSSLAAQAGARMLARGGSAADGIIAAAAVLTVVEPISSGLGADAFALVHHSGQVEGLNGSGRAPHLPPACELAAGVPDLGWPSVTVPGVVSAWSALWERHGRLPFADLFEPALHYARDGFMVTPLVARVWRGLLAKYMKFPHIIETYYAHPRGPEPGTLLRFPVLADTLEEIARTQGESLYRGALAHRVHDFSTADGGHLRLDDLSAQCAHWVSPLTLDYGGLTLHELPPNSQGIAALIALGILRHFDLASLPAESAASWHLQIEAMKLAFELVYAQVGDINHMSIGPDELLAWDRLRDLAMRISPHSVCAVNYAAPESGGTTYLTAGDSAGMLVSWIQSNGPGFGSGLVVPGTGIALQSRAGAFHVDRGHPNGYAPGKRPFHTNCPAMTLANGRVHASFGLMGWSMQPQAHVQFVVRAAHHRQDPQMILDAPRWRVAQREPAILLEAHTPDALAKGLADLGHRIVKTEKFLPASTPFGSQMMFGGAQMIAALENGYAGASDGRREGAAIPV